MNRIYGTSDDLIEVEGVGEISAFGTNDQDHGVLVICSDGTMVEVKYGKQGRAIWQINLVNAGTLFGGLEPCVDEDAEIYSDIVRFTGNLKWALSATEWEPVT